MLSTRFIRFFLYLNWATLKKTVQRSGQQRLHGLAAEITFNAMLALFPSILALLTAIGLFESLRLTFDYLVGRVSSVAPEEAVSLIGGFAKTLSTAQNEGLFSFSFLFALWAASGALSAAMSALDQIHQIPLKYRRPFWKAKLISLALTIGTIVLLIAASFLVFVSDLIVQTLISQSGPLATRLLRMWRLSSWPAALAIIASAFALVYRYGPSRWTKGNPIIPGAIVAAILWAILSALFRYYVSNFGNYNAAYGAVGTVIVLMLWLHLSSLVMLFGEQLNFTVGESMRKTVKIKIKS